jgi:hypothetical protein
LFSACRRCSSATGGSASKTSRQQRHGAVGVAAAFQQVAQVQLGRRKAGLQVQRAR